MVLTFAEPASAEPRPRIVMVTNHADAAIVPLLRSQLERLGLEVVQVDHGAEEVIPRDLSRAARQHQAVAGFRVLVARGTVEVWVSDRVTGKVGLREIVAQGADPIPDALVAIQAVELLRASLLELQAPTPPRGEVPPPPALRALASYPPPPARPALHLGIGALVAPTSNTSTLGHASAMVGARLAPWAATSIGATVRLPLGQGERPTEAGRILVSSWIFGLDLRREVQWRNGLVHLAGGPGLALQVTSAEGVPTGGFAGRTHRSLAPMPHLVGTLGLGVTPTLRVAAELLAGVSLHPLQLQVDEQQVERFGPVFLGVNLGLEILLR
ncbi:MAG: hypothetical protein MUF64_13315 [Polyangiaceae bacterium]|nr:hypothetical protein [Polyangiaceae bacterium]